MSLSKATVKRLNEKGKRPQTASTVSTKQNLDGKDEKKEKAPPTPAPSASTNVKPAATPRIGASPRITASSRITASQRTTESKPTSKAPSINSRPLSARKPLAKSIQPAASTQRTASPSPRTPKVQHNVQKQKYIKMKKELKDKQGEMIHLYDAVVKLREEMISAGVKDAEITEEPKIEAGFLGGGGEDLSAAHRRIAQATENKSGYLSALEEKLNSVSFWCFDLCQKAVTINNTVLVELGHMGRDKLKASSDSEMHKTIEGLKKESHSLMQSLEKKKKSHNDTVTEVLQEIKALLQERESLKESLKENKTANFEEELANVQSEKNALAEKLKAEILKGKGKQAETDSLLNNARQKIKDVESKVTSQETRIQGFHSQMRKFETQIRTRDRAHAMRLNDVSETTKILKESKHSLEKQKEALEQRVEDLRRIMNQKERKQEDTINKLNSQITELHILLSTEQEEKQKLESELKIAINQKIGMENLKNEIELQKKEMEKKLDEMKNAASNMKMVSGEHAKGSGTPHEEELWVRLQGTQVLLQSTQQTLAAVQEEKEKLEATLKDLMKKTEVSPKKIDDQLLEKESTITELNENIQSISAESEQKSVTISELNKKIRDLERQLAIKYYASDRGKTHGADLKHKAAELENEFFRVREQNSEMEKHIRELHAELERKQNEQAKALKDRDELIRVLKNKEKKQAEQIMDLWSLVQEHESAASTVCQDMSGKDAEIKDLQKILEIKQLQILRLEKIVRKQEEQLDRWGLQRTRQEARIAELENTLREKQRYSDYPFQDDNSSFPRQEKPANMVEKHTCRDCVSTRGEQQDYRYLNGKKIDTEMMAKERFQTPAEKTITSSYADSDWSHSQVTPYSEQKQSSIGSDWSHGQVTPHSGHNQNSKNMKDYHVLESHNTKNHLSYESPKTHRKMYHPHKNIAQPLRSHHERRIYFADQECISGHYQNSKNMKDFQVLESCDLENIDNFSSASPKTPTKMQHPYKNTVEPLSSHHERRVHFADDESSSGYHKSQISTFPNYSPEYNDVLLPEQCTTIYDNGKEAWQDATSEEGQIYHMHDEDTNTKPNFPSVGQNKAVSKSYSFYPNRQRIEIDKKQVSKSDPTPLNKSVPPNYNYQGKHDAIGDNIMIRNNDSLPCYCVGFCKVCNGKFVPDVINVHQNCGKHYREVIPVCHPEPNAIENNEIYHNLSTNKYQQQQQEKYKTFPIAEIYEAGDMSPYFPQFADKSVNVANRKQKKYLNCGRHMPEIVGQGCGERLKELLNSPVILCASPSAVLLLNCPYITNYLVHSPQLLKNGFIELN